MINAQELFGNIDIYLFDQILKNQFTDQMRILDAGCGGGRNLVYFLRSGLNVFGIDQNPEAVEHIRDLAKSLAPELPAENFRVARVEGMPFDDEVFDAVISSAVLHFADNERHFNRMIDEMWRVLKTGGLLFVRLASSIGIEDKIKLIESRHYWLPDGSERFLVDQEFLLAVTTRLGGVLAEPIKTTNVQNLRCMTTWVIRKQIYDVNRRAEIKRIGDLTDRCFLKAKVHAADILDNRGGKLLLENLNEEFSQIRHCWADMAYRGDFPKWCKDNLGWTIEIVKRARKWGWYPEDVEPKIMPRFTVLKRRWVVERTIAWLGRNRRMSKDYEFLTQPSESFIYAAMS